MSLMRCVLLLVMLPFLLGANTHPGTTDTMGEVRAWFGDAGTGYVVSNCIPTSSPTTTTTAACQAYVQNSAGALIYVTQASASIGPLTGGDGTYWVSVHKDISTAVSGWTRQAGTHYLWKLAGTEPPTPADSLLIAALPVSGGQIGAVRSLGSRTLIPANIGHFVSATDYGVAVNDGNDDSAGLAAALATGNPVQLPCGTILLAATVAVPAQAILRGCGQGDGTTAPTMIELSAAVGFTMLGSGGSPVPYGVILSDFALKTLAGGSTTGIQLGGVSRILLERLSFIGAGGGFSQGGLLLDAHLGLGVQDVVIRQSFFSNTDTDGLQIGSLTFNVTIEQSIFDTITGRGIHVTGIGNKQLTIVGNSFRTQSVANVTLKDTEVFTVRDNQFNSTVPQVQVVVAGGGTMRNGMILGNTFTGNTTNTGIELGAAGVAIPTRAVVIQGNQFNSLSVGISFPEPTAQGTDTFIASNTFVSVTTPISGRPGAGSTITRPGNGLVSKEYGTATAVTVTNTTTVTPLVTFTVPAATIDSDGGLYFRAWGEYFNNTGGGVNLAFTLVYGTTATVLDCTHAAVPAGASFRAWEISVWLHSASTGTTEMRSVGTCTLSPLLTTQGLYGTVASHLMGRRTSTAPDMQSARTLVLNVAHASASTNLIATLYNATLMRLPKYE